MNNLAEFDIQLLRPIHHCRIESLDNLLLWLSGSTYYIAAGIMLCLGVAALLRNPQKFRHSFARLIVMLASVTLAVLALKYTILRTRPFEAYTDIVNLSDATSPSFPSGHTVIAFTIAFGFMFSGFNKLHYLPLLVWAAAVAYSRLALGAHFPSDVLTSIAIALVAAFIAGNPRKNPSRNMAE